MNLSEPFHVANEVKPGGVLRPYFFAVYLHDLSLEPRNIKAGCYIDEILLNLLTFVAHILGVLSKCTWVAKNTRCVSG